MSDARGSGDEKARENTSAHEHEHSGDVTVLGVSKPKLIVGLVGLAVVIITILQNTEPTKVKFLFWSPTLPRWILLTLVFGAGAAAGVFIPKWRKRKKKSPLVG